MSIFTIYFLISQILWGFFPVFWKQLAMLDPVYLLSVRIVFSSLFCGICLLFTDHAATKKSLMNGKLMRRLSFASIFITLNWGLYIYLVNNGHIFDASLAYFIGPILCLLFSAFIFREPMNRWQTASILVAAAGILAAFLVYGTIPWRALLLCSPFAIYSAIKKGLQVSGMFSVFAESLVMTLPSLAIIIWYEMHGMGAIGVLSGWEWILIPATGVVTSVPMIFFAAGLRGVAFSVAAILMYGSPVIQLFLAPLYGEVPSPAMLTNAPVVVAAVILFITGNLRQAKRIRDNVNKN